MSNIVTLVMCLVMTCARHLLNTFCPICIVSELHVRHHNNSCVLKLHLMRFSVYKFMQFMGNFKTPVFVSYSSKCGTMCPGPA